MSAQTTQAGVPLWKTAIIACLFTVILLVTNQLWQKPVPAPAAIFTTIKGQKISLTGLRGKPVLVTFWATDCRSCIEEIPHLLELYQTYQPRGLEIIAVAMYYDPPNHVLEMAKSKQIPYPIALDVQAEHARAFGKVLVTPTTFLINPHGEISWQTVGLFELAEMKQRIEQLLAG